MFADELDEKWISWDFDNTLYDWSSRSINSELFKIFEKQRKEGKNVCIVTLRTLEECPEVRYHFPDIRIFYTAGHDKVRYLLYKIPINIVEHYDDRLDTCLGLIGSRIKPVWVFSSNDQKKFDKLTKIYFNSGNDC